jgi:hypothetical protein
VAPDVGVELVQDPEGVAGVPDFGDLSVFDPVHGDTGELDELGRADTVMPTPSRPFSSLGPPPFLRPGPNVTPAEFVDLGCDDNHLARLLSHVGRRRPESLHAPVGELRRQGAAFRALATTTSATDVLAPVEVAQARPSQRSARSLRALNGCPRTRVDKATQVAPNAGYAAMTTQADPKATTVSVHNGEGSDGHQWAISGGH